MISFMSDERDQELVMIMILPGCSTILYLSKYNVSMLKHLQTTFIKVTEVVIKS